MEGLLRSYPSIFLFLFFFSQPFLSLPYQIESNERFTNYSRIQVPSAVGPESLAFDCKGNGPYTGVSDGRILKWRGAERGWAEFAFTSPNWKREVCNRSIGTELEKECGRPLGLEFNKATCKLYIADAYFGLMVVGKRGGIAKQLVSSAEGVPLKFANALDVDHKNGLVYFTDSSSTFPRWQASNISLTGDKTGRLMKYDIKKKKVSVLLRGLAFANGVSVSKDKAYVLVAEFVNTRILKYWLQGPKAKAYEVFTKLEANIDNIKRNAKGEFWVAVRSTKPEVGLKFDEEGKVLEVLNSNGGETIESISEINEICGNLWLGSVIMPYIGHYDVIGSR